MNRRVAIVGGVVGALVVAIVGAWVTRTPAIDAQDWTRDATAGGGLSTPTPATAARPPEPTQVERVPQLEAEATVAPEPSSPPAEAYGNVVDPSGVPIVGATVLALRFGGEVQASATTDAAGAFTFGDLARPPRFLHASARGRCSRVLSVGSADPLELLATVELPARIVLEPGAVAVARLRWSDGTPCEGRKVHLGPSRLLTTGIWTSPLFGPWPPAISDANGRAELPGLPLRQVLGLGVPVFGREFDAPHPFETGAASNADGATEQLFVIPRSGSLTIELRGLESIQELGLEGSLDVQRVDGKGAGFSAALPPFTRTFERAVVGGRYAIAFMLRGADGRFEFVHLDDRLEMTEVDQRVTFDCVIPPHRTRSARSSIELGPMLWLRLMKPDGSAITMAQLRDAGLDSSIAQCRYGSLDPTRIDDVGSVEALQLEGHGGGIGASVQPRCKTPLWIELSLGELRSRAEVTEASHGSTIDLSFDLSAVAPGTMVRFHARNALGAPVQLMRLALTDLEGGETLHSAMLEPGPLWRTVPPGHWRYECSNAEGVVASGLVDVPTGSAVEVDVILPGAGAVQGRIVAMPGGTKAFVALVRPDGPANLLDPTGWSQAAADGSFAFTSVTPGEWQLVVLLVDDGTRSARCESSALSVRAGEVTRRDSTLPSRPGFRFRFEASEPGGLRLEVRDADGRIVMSGPFESRMTLELAAESCSFRACRELRGQSLISWDTKHWIDGVLTPGDDGTTTVRFDFPTK